MLAGRLADAEASRAQRAAGRPVLADLSVRGAGRGPAALNWPGRALPGRRPHARAALEARRRTDATSTCRPRCCAARRADPRGDAELVVATLDGCWTCGSARSAARPPACGRGCGACSPPLRADLLRRRLRAGRRRRRSFSGRAASAPGRRRRPAPGPPAERRRSRPLRRARTSAAAGAELRLRRQDPAAPLVAGQHAGPRDRPAAPADRHAEDRATSAATSPRASGRSCGTCAGEPRTSWHGPARGRGPRGWRGERRAGAAAVIRVGGSPGPPGAVAGVVPTAAPPARPGGRRRAAPTQAHEVDVAAKGRAQVPS